MAKEKKGIASIFGEGIEDILEEIEGTKESKEPIVQINVKDIVANPYQPRKQFDNEKLEELAQSFKEHGVFTPIIVKKGPVDKYYLIAGERRTRAAKLANLKTIPAVVKDINDDQMQEIALLENIQRENLNPIEEAISYKSIMDKQGLTQEMLSMKVGKSRSNVANSLRLLNLNKKILDYVTTGTLSFGHVKPLITLDDQLALKVAQRAIDEKLNVRDVEGIVKGYQLKESSSNSISKPKSNQYDYVEELFKSKLKTKVTVKEGKIIIPFKDNDALNKLLERMNLLDDE